MSDTRPDDKTWPDICTASGAGVWFLEPERTPIRARDLFTHLPRVCRYNGALPWNDLQHLALCVKLGEHLGEAGWKSLAHIAAHDMHEAYVGDLPTHLKRHLPNWKPIEDAWEARVHGALGLVWPLPPDIKAQVKLIDRMALCVEMERMGHAMAAGVAERRNVVITAWMRKAWQHVKDTPANEDLWHDVSRRIPSLRAIATALDDPPAELWT